MHPAYRRHAAAANPPLHPLAQFSSLPTTDDSPLNPVVGSASHRRRGVERLVTLPPTIWRLPDRRPTAARAKGRHEWGIDARKWSRIAMSLARPCAVVQRSNHCPDRRISSGCAGFGLDGRALASRFRVRVPVRLLLSSPAACSILVPAPECPSPVEVPDRGRPTKERTINKKRPSNGKPLFWM